MIRKIIIICLVFILLLSGTVHGFYGYESRFMALKLSRTNTKLNFTVSYDNTKIKSRNS